MKYLTIINQELADGTDASAMHAHDTKAEAMAEFHSELAAGVVSTALRRDFAMVVDTDGNVIRIESAEGLAPKEEKATEEAK